MSQRDVRTGRLMQLVKESREGAVVLVDDLAVSCSSLSELSEAIMKAYKKNVVIRSLKQRWFDMNATGENPVITTVRLAKLDDEMKNAQTQRR